MNIHVFRNAWRTAVNTLIQINTEYKNSPNSSHLGGILVWRNKIIRLHKWSANRWGLDKVADEIDGRE